jgi:signal transduction histidine kinase/PAS domain-containing protein
MYIEVGYNHLFKMTRSVSGIQQRFNKLKYMACILVLVTSILLIMPVIASGGHQAATRQLVLSDDQGKYNLGTYLDILEDPGGELAIKDVSSPAYATRFIPSQADIPSFGLTRSAIWARLQLHNASRLNTNWLLEFYPSFIGTIDLFTPLPGSQDFSVKQSGMLRPLSTRDLAYPNVILRINIPADTTQTIYIRLQSDTALKLRLILWSPVEFARGILPDQLVLGIFFGLIWAMLLYNLLLFFALRDPNYLYLVLMLVSITFLRGDAEGYTNLYLYQGRANWLFIAEVISRALLMISLLLFTGSFLRIKTQLPRAYPALIVLIGGYIFDVCIYPFIGVRQTSTIFHILQFPALIFMLVVSILLLVKHRSTSARSYLIACTWVILCLLGLSLARLNVIPDSTLYEYAYSWGFVWMALAISWGLVDRINSQKNEIQNANQELAKNQIKLDTILETLPIGVVVYEKDRRPSFINQCAKEILSNPRRKIQPDLRAHRTIEQASEYFTFKVRGTDQVYPVDKLPVARAFKGKVVYANDIEAELIDRRVPLDVWAIPVRDQNHRIDSVICVMIDITDRIKNETELDHYRQDLEMVVVSRTADLEQSNKELRSEISKRTHLEITLQKRLEWLTALNKVNQVIASSVDQPKLYDDIFEIVNDLFGSPFAFIADGAPSDTGIIIRHHSIAGELRHDLIGSIIYFTDIVLIDALRERLNVILLPKDNFNLLPGPLANHFKADDIETILLLPLLLRDRIMGYLGLELNGWMRNPSDEEITLLEILSVDIAQLIENTEMLENAQEMIAAEERSRLARDLHDSVTQVLFAASLVAEVLPRIWKRNPEKGEQNLEELRHLTRGALAEMRTMLLELRPNAVIKTPLHDLLSQLTEAVTSRTGLPFQLFIEKVPAMPEDTHIGFYRIAQESLNNVVKHANASLVILSLNVTPPVPSRTSVNQWEVKMVVKDNGRGFDTQKLDLQHLGLAIMHERAEAMHATLNVESKIGEGTSVTVTWIAE